MIKEIIDAERWTLPWKHMEDNLKQHNTSLDRIEAAVTKHIDELEFDKANLVDRIIGLEIHKTGVIGQGNRIAELEAQNLNMMALFRDFYETEFNRDECWEIIKKYGGDA